MLLGMALVRILVDGFSLLHGWPELASGRPRHSDVAREALVQVLRQYSDACGTPITVVYDGRTGVGRPSRARKAENPEVLYTESGQTADAVIERVTHRMKRYGEVLVVTDDYAERDTILSLGGLASNCENFIRTVQSSLADLEREVAVHNRRERSRFRL